MSGGVTKRPAIRWPLYVTAWCFVAAVGAGKVGNIALVVVACVQVIAAWGYWLTSEPREDS